MADIDAVDNQMGRGEVPHRYVGDPTLYVACRQCGRPLSDLNHPYGDWVRDEETPKLHAFQGSKVTASCDVCGTLRIHSNHRGYDYDVTEIGHGHTKLCKLSLCVCKPSPTIEDAPTVDTACSALCFYGTGGEIMHHITCCNYTVPAREETIAEEAARIVYGDREQTYDDPNQNFRRIAHIWTGTLLGKLQPGCTVSPEDVALMMVGLKIAREVHRPKRDNRVDMIGYILCDERIIQAAGEWDEDDNATG